MYIQCDNDSQHQALEAVIGERRYQDAKWGTIEDRPKQVGSWMTLMRKLLRDAEDNWATSDNDQGALAELRKVVAVGLACFEQHGVPERALVAAPVEPAPSLPSVQDARLAGVTNNQLHEHYEALRYQPHGSVREVLTDSGVIAMTLWEFDAELTARGDSPIPF